MMEKIVLLIEHSAESIRCLLNPEQLEIRRETGVVARRLPGAQLGGTALSDDPLLYAGAGRTEFTLDLLFDVSLAVRRPESPPIQDVRELTRPLWNLAENMEAREPYARPPSVYFMWGTSWALRGVVTAASERLEQFSPDGRPRRSWLRLRLLRVSTDHSTAELEPAGPPIPLEEAGRRIEQGEVILHEPIGDGAMAERADQIAAQYTGHPAYWPLIARISGIDNPLHLAGSLLQVPAEPSVINGARR